MVHIKSSGDYPGGRTCTSASGKRWTNERTKSGAIDGACEFTEQMIPNLEAAANHPDMTEELADVLSTRKVRVDYEVRSGIHINSDERAD